MDRELILDVRDVSYRYAGAGADALAGVSLAARAGEVHAVLGPNGSGKTTLVRVALGVLAASTGGSAILGRPASAWSRRELARLVGVVTQREENLFPQRVRETVLLGRYARLSLWGAERPEDRAAVTRALERCDVLPLADRWIWALVLDEPTASLDVRHEMELFQLVRALADRDGLAVVLITHHVTLAARFADRVLLLSGGRPAGHGTPGDVLTRETVERVFAWPVSIAPFEGRPQVIPLRKDPS